MGGCQNPLSVKKENKDFRPFFPFSSTTDKGTSTHCTFHSPKVHHQTNMPFFRDTMDGAQDAIPSAAAAATAPPAALLPLPIHGLAHQHSATNNNNLRYRPSEESIRTELCEGPLLAEAGEDEHVTSSPRPESAAPLCVTTATSDRAELIERLKRGESPTWVPTRRVCVFAFFASHTL